PRGFASRGSGIPWPARPSVSAVRAFTAGVARGVNPRAAFAEAAVAATEAAAATAALTPRLGRARPLAERSVGTPDAGALSLALCARTVAALLGDGSGDSANGGDDSADSANGTGSTGSG
ncbi:DAK2 domain-containing protein, partial [Streptomyces sp. NPDC048845]|uniref:DAK2 domain-containing protein n=1 Tax=Streptomyces sp. NPDC048845 TaxID=3155390 RepID=UPI0034378847